MIGPYPSVLENVPLADKTTYCIGGMARWYAQPESPDEVRNLIRWAHENGLPLLVLGRGSNMLVSDSGWPGLVLHISSSDTDSFLSWEGSTVQVPGGIALHTLVSSVADKGFCGIEELAGIPGTVAGGVIMNAGAFTQCIGDTLADITCCHRSSGDSLMVAAEDLALGYRTSSLRTTGDIVLNARFTFSEKASPELLHGRRQEILARRKAKQPLEYPSCGSVFKRPPGNYAGTLIEKCGLKGYTIGGAQVSEKHANFIINTAHATAKEVRGVIVTIQQRVYEACGILLEPEVIFIGDFEQDLFSPSMRN